LSCSAATRTCWLSAPPASTSGLLPAAGSPRTRSAGCYS
jgi:hypothetical protein